jgi:hypothetical protein
MPSDAADKKLSTCCTDMLTKQFMGLQKIVYLSKILKKEWNTFAK